MSAPKREKPPAPDLPERQVVLMPEGVVMRLLGHWRTFGGTDQRHAAYPVDITAEGQRWVLQQEPDKEGRWVYLRSDQ